MTQSAVQSAERYYDGADADQFYFHVWGGEDIHVGLYEHSADIKTAGRLIVEHMAALVAPLGREHRVLDLGAGYGGAARVLAREYGCRVVCANISERQNETNRRLSAEQGLQDLIEVRHEDFEVLSLADASFDVVWSQDAILHSSRKDNVLAEAYRVLKPGGRLIFTDPMQADHVPDPEALRPVLDRLDLNSLGSFGLYDRLARDLGFEPLAMEPMLHNLRAHYQKVAEVLRADYARMTELSSKPYIDKMLVGLDHWVRAADAGNLAWGVLAFRKPD